MSKLDIADDYSHLKLHFRCERCNSVSTLKRPALNASVLLVVGGPFLFAPTFYAIASALPATLGLAYALPAGLGAAAVAYLGVLLLGRFTQKYVPMNVLPNSALLTDAYLALRASSGAAKRER